MSLGACVRRAYRLSTVVLRSLDSILSISVVNPEVPRTTHQRTCSVVSRSLDKIRGVSIVIIYIYIYLRYNGAA